MGRPMCAGIGIVYIDVTVPQHLPAAGGVAVVLRQPGQLDAEDGVAHQDRQQDQPAPAWDCLAAGQPESDQGDDAWRGVFLETLSVEKKLLDALQENEIPIRTLGHLADWTQDHELTDIKGIGPAAAEKIDQATANFWSIRAEG